MRGRFSCFLCSEKIRNKYRAEDEVESPNKDGNTVKKSKTKKKSSSSKTNVSQPEPVAVTPVVTETTLYSAPTGKATKIKGDIAEWLKKGWLLGDSKIDMYSASTGKFRLVAASKIATEKGAGWLTGFDKVTMYNTDGSRNSVQADAIVSRKMMDGLQDMIQLQCMTRKETKIKYKQMRLLAK